MKTYTVEEMVSNNDKCNTMHRDKERAKVHRGGLNH